MTVIEPAHASDLEAIHDIERHSFRVAWPREAFEAELARPWARVDVLRAPRVVGFCNYWLVAPGPRVEVAGEVAADPAAPGGEIHILSIAVHPDRRRDGLGGRLLTHALDAGRAGGASVATLEVRRGNTPAIAMYARAGFKTVHVRTRYYQDDGEDALVMIAQL